MKRLGVECSNFFVVYCSYVKHKMKYLPYSILKKKETKKKKKGRLMLRELVFKGIREKTKIDP